MTPVQTSFSKTTENSLLSGNLTRNYSAGSLKKTGLASLLILLTMIASTFLQKIGPTVGTFQFYFSLPLLYLIIVAGFTSGVMDIHLRRSIAFCGCFSMFMIEEVISGKDFSLGSLALLMVVHFPYAFGFKPGLLSSEKTFWIFQKVIMIIAICGIIQFSIQFIIGSRYAFFLDIYFPEIVIKMANINPITYGSSIIRSNGFFLLEPSILSQLCAISLLMEIRYFNRISRMVILAGAMIASYSGTGIMLLAIILPIFLIKRKKFFILIGLISLGISAILFAELLGLGLLVHRVNEFNQTGSSGYARFISPFPVLHDFVFTDVNSLLFGVGAGGYKIIMQSASYSVFDPSWAKVFVEYGILGFIVYIGFMGYCIFSSKQEFFLKAAIFIQFMILGGANHVPPEHALILSLLIWSGTPFLLEKDTRPSQVVKGRSSRRYTATAAAIDTTQAVHR